MKIHSPTSASYGTSSVSQTYSSGPTSAGEGERQVADVALDTETSAVAGEQTQRERRPRKRAERHAEEKHPLLVTANGLGAIAGHGCAG